MANTVDFFPSTTVGPSVITQVPMTGADVAFTFQKWTDRIWVWCSASTSSLFFASASSGHAAIVLPIGPAVPFWYRDPNLGALTVTFNGTNLTNVFVIEQQRQIG